MRKGTRSCIECRERKVRCIFSSGASKCDDCIRRDRQCIEQAHGRPPSSENDSAQNIRQWMGEIDGKVGEILKKVDLLSEASHFSPSRLDSTQNDIEKLQLDLLRSTAQLDSASPKDLGASSSGIFRSEQTFIALSDGGRVPVLSLVDNAVLKGQRDEVSSEIEQNHYTPPATFPNATSTLLRALLPERSDLILIIRGSRCAWDVWCDVFPDREMASFGRDQSASLEHRVLSLLDTNDSAVLVKILFGLAICVQQLPQEFNCAQTQLPPSPEILQNKFLAAAESVLAIDQNLCGSIDGLECMLIQSTYYVNMGKPRTAWLIAQRAISTCHVFGVFGLRRDTTGTMEKRWESIWLRFWGRDRQLSLLLGLPYASSVIRPDLIDVCDGTSGEQKGRGFWLGLGVVAGRIIDRNHNHNKMTFPLTLDIDQDMETLKKLRPRDWWESAMNPQMSLQAIEEIWLGKLLFYNTRKLLHLPFMLKAGDDRKYEYSRDATLEASREMVKIYGVLRDQSCPALSMCNLEDFQVFTAALILIINLLSPSKGHYKIDCHEADRDWELVQDVATIFRRVSRERGCSVAVQGGSMLEDFLKARYDFPGTETGFYSAVIPYFGHISLTRGNPGELEMGAAPLNPRTGNEEQVVSNQGESLFEFDANMFISQAALAQDSAGELYNWAAVGGEWPTLGDDLQCDWNSFGQRD
ncbi:hypothetical protein MMC28_001703 [Mycoblastus sanguinarius]|nr:hypothetical protein [Mycoblastus sanguinarius]